MSLVRVAVHMQPQRDENGHEIFRVALPMGAFFVQGLDKQELETARIELQEKYRALVETLRPMLPHLREGNVLRYWMLGDVINEFEMQNVNALVFVDKLSDHLARDVGYSKTMIDLCRRFRHKFSDAAQIDPTLSFDAYHRNSFDPQRAAAYERAKSSKRPRKK
ncbi:MAG: hypothetical protein EYC68_02965 [Chloroflexota bacterium]|nr:MAG: hypothetical protein EYC68_02965 [Chloroflexota bacterium]